MDCLGDVRRRVRSGDVPAAVGERENTFVQDGQKELLVESSVAGSEVAVSGGYFLDEVDAEAGAFAEDLYWGEGRERLVEGGDELLA